MVEACITNNLGTDGMLFKRNRETYTNDIDKDEDSENEKIIGSENANSTSVDKNIIPTVERTVLENKITTAGLRPLKIIL